MTRIRNDSRDRIGRFAQAHSEIPADFEETFVRVGRLACEEHYGVGRKTINKWLEECGARRIAGEVVDQGRSAAEKLIEEHGGAEYFGIGPDDSRSREMLIEAILDWASWNRSKS